MTFFHVNIFEEYVFCERKQFVINHACFWLSEKTAKEGSFVSLVTDLKISPRWALNDQCTLQALPWNNRSLEDFAAFVPKKCLESKKKERQRSKTQRFTTCFAKFFFGGEDPWEAFFESFWWSSKRGGGLSLQENSGPKHLLVSKKRPRKSLRFQAPESASWENPAFASRRTAVTERTQYPSIGFFFRKHSGPFLDG